MVSAAICAAFNLIAFNFCLAMGSRCSRTTTEFWPDLQSSPTLIQHHLPSVVYLWGCIFQSVVKCGGRHNVDIKLFHVCMISRWLWFTLGIVCWKWEDYIVRLCLNVCLLDTQLCNADQQMWLWLLMTALWLRFSLLLLLLYLTSSWRAIIALRWYSQPSSPPLQVSGSFGPGGSTEPCCFMMPPCRETWI